MYGTVTADSVILGGYGRYGTGYLHYYTIIKDGTIEIRQL